MPATTAPGIKDSCFAAFDHRGGMGPNGTVYALAQQPDGKVLMAGEFTAYMGHPAAGICRISPTGALDMSFNTGLGLARASSQAPHVRAVAIQPDGKVVCAGVFDSCQGVARRNICRLNADGSLDPAFDPGTGFTDTVFCLTVSTGGKILAGGAFRMFNGANMARLARLNSDGSADTSLSIGSGFNATVRALSLRPNGGMAVGGYFTQFNGSIQNRFCVLTEAGARDASFDVGSGFDKAVLALAIQPNGRIVVGGSFAMVNDVSRSRLCRLYPDGSIEGDYNSSNGFSGMVTSLALQADGRAVVAGPLTGLTYNATGIMRYTSDGVRDTTLHILSLSTSTYNTYAVPRVVAVLENGGIMLGGSFVSYNGLYRPNVVSILGNGSPDQSFHTATGFDAPVKVAGLDADGKIFVTGYFASVAGRQAGPICRLQPDGTLDTTFRLRTLVGTVWAAVVQPDGKLIVGGVIQYDGHICKGFCRILPDGGYDASFQTAIGLDNTYLTAMALQPDGKLVALGSFDKFGTVDRPRIVRVNTDGTLDLSFNPHTGFYDYPAAIAFQRDGKMVVGGNFGDYDTHFCNRICRINPDGSFDATFNPNNGNGIRYNGSVESTRVYAIAIHPSGRIMAGGYFNEYNNVSRSSLVRILASGQIDAAWNPGTQFNTGGGWPSVTGILMQPDGKTIVSGTFTAGGTTNDYIFRINSSGAIDPTFQPQLTGLFGVTPFASSLTLQPDGKLLVSGYISSVNGQGTSFLTRLFATTSTVDVQPDRTPELPAHLYPNPATNRFTISASESLRRAWIVDATGKEIQADQIQIEGQEATLTVSGVKPGHYTVIGQTRNGAVVHKSLVIVR